MFDPAVFAARRDDLMKAIGPHAVALVRSHPEQIRNGDAHYPYRQSSDVVYLTGFVEPDATLLLRPGAETDRVVLFVRPRDAESEVWDGPRAGLDGAKQRYGADAAYPASELARRLPELIANCEELHYGVGLDDEMDVLVMHAIARLRRMEKRGQRPPRAIVDPRAAIHEQRLFKRPEELVALREAAAISAEAHLAAMRAGKPGAWEYQLAAELDYTFRRRGGSGPGYTSIVGAGKNATVLHYVTNDAQIAAGDLVLVDAGCEFDHYTADITRTWPASGVFSPAQRAVYDIVLEAQVSAISLARTGATINTIHDHCVRALTAGMIELGLLAGRVEDRIADGSYKKFYMHGTSHWLGLDVHDAGAYTIAGKPRPLQPGMVITIEPGLYIAADAVDVPDRYRGIGVRIEDDIAITAGAPEVLTSATPKLADELERAIKAAR